MVRELFCIQKLNPLVYVVYLLDIVVLLGCFDT